MGVCACLLAVVGGSRAMGQQPPAYLPPVGTPPTDVRAAPLPSAPHVVATQTQLQPAQPAPAQPAPAQPGVADPSKGAVLNPPRPLSPFGPGQIRLPRLPGDPASIGSVPRPTAEARKEEGQYVGGAVLPGLPMVLMQGRSEILKLKDVPKRIQVADDNIVNYTLITPTELSLMPREIGTTVLNLWFCDANDKTKEKIISYQVRVLPDGSFKERLDAVYHALECEINLAFPDSRVMLRMCGDKLLVCGQAKDVAEASHILEIVRANAPYGGGRGSLGAVTPRLPLDVRRDPDPRNVGPAGLEPGIEDYPLSNESLVVNLLKVPNEQQIMLQVTVAEVNRAAARSIGLNFNIFNHKGGQIVGSNVGGIVPTISNQSFARFNTVTDTVSGLGTTVMGNIPVALDNGQIQLAISALRELNYSRLLSEPTLTTMNGQPARFQAGNLYPVPYLTGIAGGTSTLQGVGFIPTGVQLSFTPTITDKDRVRLQIAAEVSDRDPTLGSTEIAGSVVPILVTRNFDTTVELREGQTLAVAGLIQNRLGANSSRVPLFGDLPLIGRLAAFDQIEAQEQELVILITPKLVHGMEANCVPPLPGSDIFEPGDLEFYLMGRLESRRSYDYRSPVMTDINRMVRYRHCETLYIAGPHGHCANGDCNNGTVEHEHE